MWMGGWWVVGWCLVPLVLFEFVWLRLPFLTLDYFKCHQDALRIDAPAFDFACQYLLLA